MAGHHGPNDREAHSRTAGVAARREEASKIFSRFASEIGSPSLLTVNLMEASSSTASSRTVFALWRMALSVRCDNTIRAFSLDMPIERSRHPVASIARVGNRLFNPPITCDSSVCSFCGAVSARAARHGDARNCAAASPPCAP